MSFFEADHKSYFIARLTPILRKELQASTVSNDASNFEENRYAGFTGKSVLSSKPIRAWNEASPVLILRGLSRNGFDRLIVNR